METQPCDTKSFWDAQNLASVRMLTIYCVLLLSRVAHVARCLQAIKNLRSSLQNMLKNAAVSKNDTGNSGQSLLLSSRKIAAMLAVKRHYMQTTTEANCPFTFSFDPRLLVFEFAHSLILENRRWNR